jgi:hypothetical protein
MADASAKVGSQTSSERSKFTDDVAVPGARTTQGAAQSVQALSCVPPLWCRVSSTPRRLEAEITHSVDPTGRPPVILGDIVPHSFVLDPDGTFIEISQRASLTDGHLCAPLRPNCVNGTAEADHRLGRWAGDGLRPLPRGRGLNLPMLAKPYGCGGRIGVRYIRLR